MSDKVYNMESEKPKLLDQVRNLMRMRHMSHKTEHLYVADMRQYLEFIADQRLVMLGMQKAYGAKNPFSFMDLQDVQELANFFERRVSAYQVAVAGEVR